MRPCVCQPVLLRCSSSLLPTRAAGGDIVSMIEAPKRSPCPGKNYRATMLAMKIALGSDHAGFELKEKIKQKLSAQGVAVDDRGTDSTVSCDYPDFARAVAEEVAARGADRSEERRVGKECRSRRSP